MRVKIPLWLWRLMTRYGWWKYRREQKHPISIRRALFGKFPRFSSFEENEEGCPDWAKKYYDLVREKV